MALSDQREVEFTWVRGHHGHVENASCDRSPVAATKQPNPVDEGYASGA